MRKRKAIKELEREQKKQNFLLFPFIAFIQTSELCHSKYKEQDHQNFQTYLSQNVVGTHKTGTLVSYSSPDFLETI